MQVQSPEIDANGCQLLKVTPQDTEIRKLIRGAESWHETRGESRREKLNLRKECEVDKLKESPPKAELMEWSYALEL